MPNGRVAAKAIGTKREAGSVNAPICTLVWKVRVAELVAVPFGVMPVGVMAHVEFMGAPPHVRDVVAENPLRGVIEMTVVAALP